MHLEFHIHYKTLDLLWWVHRSGNDLLEVHSHFRTWKYLRERQFTGWNESDLKESGISWLPASHSPCPTRGMRSFSSSISRQLEKWTVQCKPTMPCKVNLFPKVPGQIGLHGLVRYYDTNNWKSLLIAKIEVKFMFLNDIVICYHVFNRISFLKQMASVITYNSNEQWTIMSSKPQKSKRGEMSELFIKPRYFCTLKHYAQRSRRGKMLELFFMPRYFCIL